MSKERISHLMLLFGTLLCATTGSATVSFRAAVNYPVGSKPAFGAVGDFNADRKPDLVIVNAGDPNTSDPGGVSVLMGSGDGTFQSAMNFSAGDNPGSVVVGDFDGDGKDDLAVQRQGNGDNDSGDVTVFISNGDGTFRKGQVITSAVNPSAVAIGDFDSDGKIDLAIFKQTFGMVVVLLGNGDGTFSAAKSYSTPSTPVATKLEVLDFNRDGKKDIAVTGFAGGGSILIGNGDGTFQAGSSLGSFATFDSLEFVADFNHDGNLDAILTHCIIGGVPLKRSCTELVQLNNGNGTISPAPVMAPLTNQTMTPGDFDGDGNADMAGVTSGSSALAIFVGNGDGSFQQPVAFPESSGFIAVALSADLNNDSAPDLISINIDNTVGVILNSGTDFSLSASPIAPSTIGAGQSATSTLNLQLLNSFDNPVSLACSIQDSQPGAPTCSLNANSVSFDSSGKATATVTITAGTLATLETTTRVKFWAVLWLPIAGFAFFGSAACSRRRTKHTAALMFGLIGLLTLISLAACGGGSASKSGPTNYAVTITGTSGQTSHSTTANVIVE